MSFVLNLSLRLSIWMLLTMDVSILNVLMGTLVSAIMPMDLTHRASLKVWSRAILDFLISIPIAYVQTIDILLRPHKKSEMEETKIDPHLSSGLLFLKVLTITFTPKTIVTKYKDDGSCYVHHIKRDASS
jgi:multicomponent Na+:H+ antiporter subunit E